MTESTTNICVWPDGTWCYRENLEEFLVAPCAKSDDFIVVDVGDSDEGAIEAFVVRVNNGELANNQPQLMSDDEHLKQNVLELARHHKQHCDGVGCTIQLFSLYRLLERAGISLTNSERRELS